MDDIFVKTANQLFGGLAPTGSVAGDMPCRPGTEFFGVDSSARGRI